VQGTSIDNPICLPVATRSLYRQHLSLFMASTMLGLLSSLVRKGARKSILTKLGIFIIVLIVRMAVVKRRKGRRWDTMRRTALLLPPLHADQHLFSNHNGGGGDSRNLNHQRRHQRCHYPHRPTHPYLQIPYFCPQSGSIATAFRSNLKYTIMSP